MPDKRTMQLSRAKGKKTSTSRKGKSADDDDEEEEPRRKKPAAKRPQVKSPPKKSRNDLMGDDDDDDEDDDDEILDDEEDYKSKKTPILFIVIGVLVVLVVLMCFLIFSGRGKNDVPDVGDDPTQGTDLDNPYDQFGYYPGQESVSPTLPEGIGTQDFTQDTTMTTSDHLDNPDEYLTDIYGLTTRVDYTVESITTAADFVNYEKKRGTWGGGLELYWLDVTYQGNKYVVQVPFQYYKELSDTGIIPVQMEVLSVQGSTVGETLTVISYMSLDATTLDTILKQQGRK